MKLLTISFFAIVFLAYSCSKKDSVQPTLSVGQQSLSIGASTGSKDTVAIASNNSWTATSDQSWLSVSPSSGNGNTKIIATAAANFGDSITRSANITISVQGLPSQNITVTQ